MPHTTIYRSPIAVMILAAALATTRAAYSQDTQTPGPPDTHALPTLFIVGDSTVKNGTRGAFGWGEKIGALFDQNKIKIQNRAIAGRSSRTFLSEGRWDKILADAQPGDYVIIQMGHNDGGRLDDPARARGSLPGTGEETREIDNPVTGKH